MIREQDFRMFRKGSSVTSLFGVPLCKHKLLSFSHLQEAESSLLHFLFERMLLALDNNLHHLFLCFVSSAARF